MRSLAYNKPGPMRLRIFPIGNRKSEIGNRQSAFTLLEIMVAVGVLVILGIALVGMMTAAVEAWRGGESSRQVQEKLQALRRQLDEDFAAAVVDQPPVPDYHYTLDTLWDLPTNTSDPYYILDPSNTATVRTDTSPGYELRYFAPGAGADQVVLLRMRVPFVVGAALLKARLDVFDREATARLEVCRNDPTAATPQAPAGNWTIIDSINEGTEPACDGAIGGGEIDISEVVRGGDIVFVRATLHNAVADTAQFLRGDTFRSEGRPVLILDCYRDPNALPQPPWHRPVFKAYFDGGTQIVSFSRTIPGETERAVLREAGSGGNSEWLNYFDDNGVNGVDEPAELKPLGGRAQVVYRFVPFVDKDGKPIPAKAGLGILRRAFEAPIGRLITEIPAHDFITNVLYFGVTFWGADTTTWELQPELDPDYATHDPRPHPPSRRWLSSRYMPEQVQVTLVLEPDRGKRVTTALGKDLPADWPADETGLLVVGSTKGFYDAPHSSDTFTPFLRDPRHYIKIGDEWIYYDRVASGTAFVVPKNGRGARGTVAAAHPADSEIYRGVTSVFTLRIPAFRHWER